MKSCVQSFRTGVDELLTFLASTEHETELTGLLLQRQDILNDRERELLSKIASARTDRKRYLYTVSIVSLYGLLERFVDSLIETSISRISSSVSSYEKMPEKIRENHIPLSLALIKAIGEERHRSATTQEEVIANLHSCLTGNAEFRVNGAAFVLHRGNISLTKVSEFLSALGVNNHLRRITRSPVLLDFFRGTEPERDILKIADQELPTLLHPIDDLVERRNQVSHGVINIAEIESIDLLKERCRFVKAYGEGLYYLMVQEALKYHVEQDSVKHLGKPIAVYDKSIVCFEIVSTPIMVGNSIAASTGDELEPFRYGDISSLQIDKVPHQEILAEEPMKIGARISFKASEKFDYFLLPDGLI